MSNLIDLERFERFLSTQIGTCENSIQILESIVLDKSIPRNDRANCLPELNNWRSQLSAFELVVGQLPYYINIKDK